MTTNLPRRYDTGAPPAAPSAFTTAGRIERRTQRDVQQMTAQHFKDLIATQQDTERKAAEVQGAIYVEAALHNGLADFGDAVTNRLNGASALSEQLVAESLAGSLARITRKAERFNS